MYVTVTGPAINWTAAGSKGYFMRVSVTGYAVQCGELAGCFGAALAGLC